MKTKLITLLVLAIFGNTYAQFGPRQIISNNDSAKSVYATDIDGDGDMDVISCGSKIAWYENDGDGNFGAEQIINFIVGGRSVYATDIDGDGDMDVLSASSGNDNKISWYENTDGLGDFGPEQVINNVVSGLSVYAEDIDGDGDMDVLSADLGGDKIAWYENTDGLGDFGSQQIITTNANGPTSVYATDIDGDEDIDVLSASRHDNKIAWYENDGDGNFGSQQIIKTNAFAARSVYATDIDDDGDMDVLSASSATNINKIAWYENTDGLGDFGSQQIITTNADGVKSVYATDIDSDGDMDVLSASSATNINKIAWYENDGDGNFGAEQIITTNVGLAKSVYAEDLDGDGDMDVLSASTMGGPSPFGSLVGTSWYENLHPLGVDENTLLDISIFPNPVKDVLNIQSETAITEIEIYNQLGQLVKSNTNKNTIDISSVSQGIYFIKIKDENGNIGTQKVVKN